MVDKPNGTTKDRGRVGEGPESKRGSKGDMSVITTQVEEAKRGYNTLVMIPRRKRLQKTQKKKRMSLWTTQ